MSEKMKLKIVLGIAAVFVLGVLAFSGFRADLPSTPDNVDEPLLPLPARWKILRSDFKGVGPLSGLAFEWEYFMVHDHGGRFTGSLGFVFSDPKGQLSEHGPFGFRIMPSGGSMAISGRYANGEKIADYDLFGVKNTVFSKESKNIRGELPELGRFAEISSSNWSGDSSTRLKLQGRSEHLAWDLDVSPDWADRLQPSQALHEPEVPFGPIVATDMGILPGEHWSVHMVWPRTRVVGSITRLDTGEVMPIDGHGYRENSWGSWDFVSDGWDFSILSDKASGVQWAWQTYHRSDSIDFLDVSFPHAGVMRKERFFANRKELGWNHPRWTYDATARQCVPLETTVVASNQRYVVQAKVDIGAEQIPMLSDATPITRMFFIQIHFPQISGSILDKETGKIVARFEGQGGGEFAVARQLWPHSVSADDCAHWGKKYARPFPEISPAVF